MTWNITHMLDAVKKGDTKSLLKGVSNLGRNVTTMVNIWIPNFQLPAGQKAYTGVGWTKNKTGPFTVVMVKSSGCGSKPAMTYYRNTFQNYCAYCKKTDVLVPHSEGWSNPNFPYRKWGPEGEITCLNCDVDYCGATGYSLEGSCRYKLNFINENKTGVPVSFKPGFVNGTGSEEAGPGEMAYGDGGYGEQQEKSNFLSGESTFKDIIDNICTKTDTLFLCKKSHIHITDFPSLYAQASYLRNKSPETVESENIKLWQLEDGSYKLNVDQYGFYNTVKIKYNQGTWTETYLDLVRIYGEQAITYEHPKIDKYQAIAMAKAYLAAHIRDFTPTINATILHDGGIDIGDIVTLENPQTLRDKLNIDEGREPEYLYVKGISCDWEGDELMLNDLELTYSPSNPDNPEVPEVGGTGAQAETAVTEVLGLVENIAYGGGCGADTSCVQSSRQADCWGMSALIQQLLAERGIESEIRQYPTSYSDRHRSVLYKAQDGSFKRFPYRASSKINTMFYDTDAVMNGTVVV